MVKVKKTEVSWWIKKINSIWVFFSSCDICYTEGPQSLNWAKIMKTITDDLDGFFVQGGWTFLEADSEGENNGEGGGDDSDVEEDDYDPDEDESGEEGKRRWLLGENKRYLKWNVLGSESDYSAEDDDDDEDFDDEESGSGMKDFYIGKNEFCCYLDESEKLGTDEESGKSWSELEEEARKGWFNFYTCLLSFLLYSLSWCWKARLRVR